MSKISIEMFPARDGDCFLINYGDKLKKHILIDGGRKETYKCYLKKRFKEINSKNEMINLIIVTHIDSDHIEGVIELLKDNKSSKIADIVRINEIWHNGFCHIPENKEKCKKISDLEEEALEEIIALNSNSDCESVNENSEISYRQGNTLFDLICKGNYKWNDAFDKKAINSDFRNEINFESLKIKILSPDLKKLERINKKWFDKLGEYRTKFQLSDEALFDSAFELYMRNYDPNYTDENCEIAYRNYKEKNFLELLNARHENDNSVTNGASISLIIEYYNKKMLFLGDSHIGVVKKNIKKMIENEKYETYFDIIKLSHHGSIKNISKDFLKMIDGDKYLVSTDGTKHGHPDLPVFAWIVDRKKDIHKKLVFNYRNHAVEYYNNFELMEKHNYSIIIPENEKSVIIDL